ncbi:gamma-glutamylcyclotransferase family protein [Streptomyces sp. URMC 129]|uniref:gamma-glutamylcyclotransferase family protein n=1 Tax=Streptomyces sp. URMC 129 TaxID=3423407 RepID=UPI003F1BFFEB
MGVAGAPEGAGAAEAERLPFFVYGTLRPGQVNHAWALRGRTAAEEPARLPGAVLYDGPGYPYAVPAPGDGAGAVVSGELIHPLPDHYAEVLAVLDRLEEYAPGAPDNVYERVAVDVLRAAGGTARAWVYLAAAPLAARLRASGTPIPGGDWLTG